MEERSIRAEQLQAAGNGKRCGSCRAVVAVSFECGSACQFRQDARGGECSQRNAGFFEEASAVQQSLCGDVAARKEIGDRLDGRPPQTIEGGDIPLITAVKWLDDNVTDVDQNGNPEEE